MFQDEHICESKEEYTGSCWECDEVAEDLYTDQLFSEWKERKAGIV